MGGRRDGETSMRSAALLRACSREASAAVTVLATRPIWQAVADFTSHGVFH